MYIPFLQHATPLVCSYVIARPPPSNPRTHPPHKPRPSLFFFLHRRDTHIVHVLCLCTGDYDGLGKIRVPELRASCKVLVPTVANVMYVMRCCASFCVYVCVYLCVCVSLSPSLSHSQPPLCLFQRTRTCCFTLPLADTRNQPTNQLLA